MSQDQGHDSAATLKPRRLLRGEITYSAAKEQDANILHELGYRDKKIQFFTYLYRNRKRIQKLIARHLGLASADACRVVEVEDWIHGSFNVCIRADIVDRNGDTRRRVMIRFPLPYRIGEKSRPGNADEKVRCEVGTYVWLKENCPNIPIPHLYGFGLSSGKRVCPPFFYTYSTTYCCLLLVLVYRPRQPSIFDSKYPASAPMAFADLTLPGPILLCPTSQR